MKTVILNLILHWNVLFLLQQYDLANAVEIGAQVDKYETDKLTLQKRKKRLFKILPVAKLSENKSDLLLQQVENDKLIKESFEDVMNVLEDVDISTYPELEGVREAIAYYQNETSKAMADIIEIFEMLEKEQTSAGYEITTSSNINQHTHKQDEEDEGDRFFDENNHESRQEKYRSFHKRARKNAKLNGYDHFYDMHDAMHYGDHDFLEKMMSRMNRDNAESRMYENPAQRKEKECNRLKKCAKGMTLYDVFMFFYSDYVDETTGNINTNAKIVRFDERDLVKKHNKLEKILSGSVNCDHLLEYFHKTSDNKGVPEWHGATVDEVCEARDTADYVSLTGIMSGVRDLNTFFDDSVPALLLSTVNEIILEIIECSASLFFSKENKSGGEFIFMDNLKSKSQLDQLISQYRYRVKHSPSNVFDAQEMNKLQFPFAIDLSTSGCEFVKLSNNYFKDSINPHDEKDKTMSAEQCKKECCGKSWCNSFTCKDPYVEGGKNMCKKCMFYDENIFDDKDFKSSYSNSKYLDSTRSNSKDSSVDTYVMGKCEWEVLGNGKWNVGWTYADKDPGISEDKCLANTKNNEDYLGYDYYDDDDEKWCYYTKYIFKEQDVRSGRYYTLKQCKLVPNPVIRKSSGQLLSQDNIGAGYLFKKYEDLTSLYKKCVEEMKTDDKMTTENALKCIKKFAEPIDNGLKLIFGSAPSSGFICGVKDAILNKGTQNSKMPGHCCLDAPYELDNAHWGHEPTCDTIEKNCKHKAPFFANLREDACAAYGGSYCEKVDCSELRNCIENFKAGKDMVGAFEKKPSDAFFLYLNSTVLAEKDVKDKDTCYEAREHFGFQGSFIQDEKICRKVWRLRNNKDFEHVSENMNKKKNDGAKGTDSGSLRLTSPTTEKSDSDVFKSEQTWNEANFGLQQVVNGIMLVIDIFEAFDCPEDITGAVKTICALTKNAIYPPLRLIPFTIQTAIDISDIRRGIDAELGSTDFAQIWETTQAIYGNMQKTGEYLAKTKLESRNTFDVTAVDEGESVVAKQGDYLLLNEPMENMETKEEVRQSENKMEKMADRMEKMENRMEKMDDKMDNKMEKMEHTLGMMMQMLENVAASKESNIQ